MREKREMNPRGSLLQSLQFPDDLRKGNALVSMHGQERLWIENFKGISAYSQEEIRLLARNCCICVTGRRLEIVSYTKEEIEIAGHIAGIAFLE